MESKDFVRQIIKEKIDKIFDDQMLELVAKMPMLEDGIEEQ